MTEQEQRITIAEQCGWRFDPVWERVRTATHGVLRRGDELRTIDELPDFPNDLNAMHEAEHLLSENEIHNYECELSRVTVNGMALLLERGRCFDYAHATAAKRAEAFLRTRGLWKEEGVTK